MKATWDIFCSVVDNYGDIGVTWRLARQLVAEHGLAVRLWVDDLQAFTPMCPGADASAAQQWQHGVDVRQWPAASAAGGTGGCGDRCLRVPVAGGLRRGNACPRHAAAVAEP